MSRLVRYATGLAFAAFLVVGAWYVSKVFFGFDAMEYAQRREFDSGAWKKAEETGEPTRVHMIDDLMRRYKLVGMKRAEINELLGVPRKTTYFSHYEYVYWLGPERGFMSIDSEWLCLKFGNDVVIEAVVLHD